MLFLLVSLLYVVQSVQAHCSPPEKIPNGQVSYPSIRPMNTTATYTCNSGYVITSGNAIRVCMEFYYTGTAPTCSDMNECALSVHKCNANALCTNTVGSYTCTCNSGYSGDGVTCSAKDPCISVNSCHSNAKCSKTAGNYTCTCITGYSGDGFTCSDKDECGFNKETCDINAECSNTTGCYTCSCKPGYSGDGITCLAVCSLPPPPIANGYSNYTTPLKVGSQATYYCDEGFIMSSGDVTITCQENGIWSVVPATCKALSRLQQDENYREFMGWLTDGGLRYAVAKKNGLCLADKYHRQTVDKDHKLHIIIVGAGISGLASAYELAQTGHNVTILEMQSRVGGRIKTIREGLYDGLHSEAGAMRLPYNHFLTKHYIDTFGIETRPFQNHNEEGFIYIYGDKIKIKDWKRDNAKYSRLYFSNWDQNLSEGTKSQLDIKGIDDYYERTMDVVKKELGDKPTDDEWRTWISKWNKLSVEDFLRSDIYQSKSSEHKLRPWTEDAITGYKVSNYRPRFSQDLTTYLREELGNWWQDPLYTPQEGMDTLPKAFVQKNDKGWNKEVELSKHIRFGFEVQKIVIEPGKEPGKDRVLVSGVNRVSCYNETIEGDAVILTPLINILRQLDVPFSRNHKKALENLSYSASTKIMLQCKTRFWQKEVGQGGFSRTDLPIGQFHYPDYNGSGISDDSRGVLMVYSWDQDAMTFGAQTHEGAIRSAVEQISQIHPEMKEQFEVGVVQAWYSDPGSQGAYASLKPFEYISVMELLTTPEHPIYLAGEALSWSNGWIQGAVYSALMQAYCIQSRLEDPSYPCVPMQFLQEMKDNK